MKNNTNNAKDAEGKSFTNNRSQNRGKFQYGKGKSGRNNRKNKGKEQFSDATSAKLDMRKAGANDISWYAESSDLLRDVASIPWSTQNGLTYSWNADYVDANSGTLTTTSMSFTNPGILCARVVTGIGNVEQQLDAVNIAANAIYTDIRHYNSGHANYDAPDLMMYLLQMDEIYCAINWVQRILGTIGMYNVYNRYTPKTLLEMQGVDFEDIKSNQVWLRAQLNTLIIQAATLVVPNKMPLYARHRWMFSNYYIEGDDMKDQIYFYTPQAFRKLIIPAGGGPGTLKRVLIPGNHTDASEHVIPRASDPYHLTAQDIVSFIYDMIQTVYLSEDFGIMAGDILKAYGESGIMRLSTYPADYICKIERNDEVLLQFKNSMCSPVSYYGYRANYANTNFGDIVQDPNTNIISMNMIMPATYLTSIDNNYAPISNEMKLTLSGASSIEMNMIMSRLQCFTKFERIPLGVNQYHVYCGTEVITGYVVCHDVDPLDVNSFRTVLVDDNSRTIGDPVWIGTMKFLSSLQCFKYAPRVLQITIDANDASIIDDIREFWQVDNFTIYPCEILDRMNAVAIMSEMAVPHLALI